MVMDVSQVSISEISVSEAIGAAAGRLSPAERKVAEVVTRDPEAVAFGTVAEVARLSGTSGPTVVRFAERVGYDGFVGLQAIVRERLSERLRPAVQRIRSDSATPVLARALEVEIENVRRTLEAVRADDFEGAVRLLADTRRAVTVLPSEQCQSPGRGFADELSLLRDHVQLAGGSEFRLVTELVRLRPDDVVVLIDLQRHERWILEAARRVAESGARRVVVSDSLLSPLARDADHAFAVSALGAGPFDSNIGVQVLLNALIAGVAGKRRNAATRRLDALEAVWTRSGALAE